MQPDREDAERDDAAVEVAAHLFFCEPFARLAPRALLCCAAVVKTLLPVAFLALALPFNARRIVVSYDRSHRCVVRCGAASRCTCARVALLQLSRRFFLVSYGR